MDPLVAIDPTPPDIHLCSYRLGERLSFADCSAAARQLPAVNTPTPFSIGITNGHPYWNTTVFGLPYRASYGQCEVWVEIVGGGENVNYHNQQVTLMPGRLRGLAVHIIDQCVATYSAGGYVTDGLGRMLDYIEHVPVDPSTLRHFPGNFQPFPRDAMFITVTVTRPNNGPPETPNKDARIAHALGDGLESRLASGNNVNNAASMDQKSTALHLISAYFLMTCGRLANWWDPFESSEMTYECDASLGNPRLSDCIQLAYSELGPLSDMLAVGPGVTKVLSSDTCHAAISASVPVVITWDQVKTAMMALVSTCINNPLHSTQGGRAYYNSKVAVMGSSRPTGRRRKRKRTPTTAIDVLPPHVNITITGR